MNKLSEALEHFYRINGLYGDGGGKEIVDAALEMEARVEALEKLWQTDIMPTPAPAAEERCVCGTPVYCTLHVMPPTRPASGRQIIYVCMVCYQAVCGKELAG